MNLIFISVLYGSIFKQSAADLNSVFLFLDWLFYQSQSAFYTLELERKMDLCLFQVHKYKAKQTFPGFELGSSDPFPVIITEAHRLPLFS